MAIFRFNPYASSVTISFRCPACNHSQRTEFFNIPSMNFGVNNNFGNNVIYYHECPQCHETYTIALYSSDHFGEVFELDDKDLYDVRESWGEDEYYKTLFDQVKEEIEEDRKYIDLFNESMANVARVIETVNGLSEKDKKVMHPMLYVNLIASMEAYLADTFIRSVLENEEYKRKFVKTFKDFERQQIPLRAIYEKMDGMEKFISDALRDVVYHNLGKVRKMYKDTLDVDLGNIGELMKAISKRHDIVHRNCKDKEGNNVRVNKEDVEELYKQVTEFVKKIDIQIHSEPMLEQEQ